MDIVGFAGLGERVATLWRRFLVQYFCLDVDLDVGVGVRVTVAQVELIFLCRTVVRILSKVEVSFSEEARPILSEDCQNALFLGEFAPNVVPVDRSFHLELFIEDCLGLRWSQPLHLRIDGLCALLPKDDQVHGMGKVLDLQGSNVQIN